MLDFRFPHRLESLRAVVAEPVTVDEVPLPRIDGLMVTNLENARYLSGFTGSNAVVIVTAEEAIFVTDGRYDLQSSYEVPGFERIILPPGVVLAVATGEVLKKLRLRRVGFESAHMTYNTYEALAKAVNPAVELVPRADLVEKIRLVKDADEIAAIRRSIALADECFEFMRTMIQVGMTETAIAWEMEMFMRGRGAQRLSFDSIVGSGPNSALIHGRPGDRIVGSSGEPEFLLCDFGCQVDGYCSDITRTFVVGGTPTDRQRALYETVAETERLALASIRPGAIGKDIDAVARDFLTERGYGDEFAHSLGHSLGRQVHDGHGFGKKSEVVLAPGMVQTVEPGVYIEGLGGVRIEDDILVTEAGCEILTRSTRELLVLL